MNHSTQQNVTRIYKIFLKVSITLCFLLQLPLFNNFSPKDINEADQWKSTRSIKQETKLQSMFIGSCFLSFFTGFDFNATASSTRVSA